MHYEIGQTVKLLEEYNWITGTVVGIGRKNLKVALPGGVLLPRTVTVPPERCAHPDESVCIVWETWKGTNGRGAYRVERELYPEHRMPANEIARQSQGEGRVIEYEYGVLRAQPTRRPTGPRH